MMLAGDEFGRTQKGTTTPIARTTKSAGSTGSLQEKGKSLIEFVQRLTGSTRFPILRRNRFLTGEYVEELGVKDVTWIHPSGTEICPERWQRSSLHCFGMLLDGRARAGCSATRARSDASS